MMKKILSLIFMLCFASQSWALLQLELTQGTSSAIPIAIVPFANSAAAIAPGGQTVPQIIQADLQNSGEFNTAGPQGLGENPQTLGTIDYSYWHQQKMDNVLIGNIANLGGGRYQVSINLVSTYPANGNSNILLSQSFTTNQMGLRHLAHHISDLVYEKLTGTRGVFSTKVAYVLVQRDANKPARYSLEVSDIDGFAPVSLLVSSQPIMSPAWSPDGKKIAYVSFENHRAAIYLQNVASGARQEISDAPGINGAPAFSPDGRQMALVLTKTGNPNIYLLNLANRQIRGLVNDWSIDTEPSYSADGKSLLFTSNRDGTPQIYRYDFASGSTSRVTYDGDYNAHAEFLPDAQGIVMMHRTDGVFGIARQDLSDSRLWVLTQTGEDESPSLAPNGKMVIYATQYGGRGVLAQVSTNGQIKLRLPAREGSVQEPAWSPYIG